MNDQSEEMTVAVAGPDVSDEDWEIRFGFNIHDCSRLRRIIYDAALRPLGGRLQTGNDSVVGLGQRGHRWRSSSN